MKHAHTANRGFIQNFEMGCKTGCYKFCMSWVAYLDV